MAYKDESVVEFSEKQKSRLTNERSSFMPHWQELSRFIQPRMGRYFTDDVNKGEKRYQSIINSRGTQSHRSMSAGLLAGVMSPTRPWFNLTTPDPDLMEYQPVLEWLYKVEQLFYAILSASNLYTMAPVLIRELGLFGTANMTQLDDFDNVTRFSTHTVGSYMLAQNEKLIVDTMLREFTMTVRQLVDTYGDKVGRTAKNLYDQGNYESRIPVVQHIWPNPDANPKRLESKFKPFRSIIYEPGQGAQSKTLSDMGFDEFPAHCPRWDVTGEDVYATDCPGMTALGDIKGLQSDEREAAKALQKMVSPPLRGPASLRSVQVNSLPGGVTLYDEGGQGGKLEPIYQVNPQLQQLTAEKQHKEARIKEAFYEDLFRSIDSMEGVQPQNQLFLSMKNAEKLLQLGPVLERLHGEFLNALIDRLFAQCVRAKLPLLMNAPPELQGSPLKVRYISSLAMAQREVATQGIDKFTMYVAGLMKAGFTSAGDVFDADEAARETGKAIGVSPKLIVPSDKVAEVRQHREQQHQQQQQMAMLQQVASAAKDAGGAVGSLAGAAGAAAPQGAPQ